MAVSEFSSTRLLRYRTLIEVKYHHAMCTYYATPVTLNFKTKSFATSGAKSKITVTQLSITPAGGQPLSARVLAHTSAGRLTTTGPELTADTRLKGYTLTIAHVTLIMINTIYTVSFSSSVNGISRSKSWKFTTIADKDAVAAGFQGK